MSKSRVLNALHKEAEFGTLINSFVAMVHHFVNSSMLFLVGDDVLVKVPITALASLKGHPSKFVLNLGASGVDGPLPMQLCVEGPICASTI